MTFHDVWIIPALATLFAFLAFFIGYGLAVANDHANAWFSYISDGGAHPPESCIFGQLLNLSAMFVALTVYLRHLQIVCHFEKEHHVRGQWKIWSTMMLFLGYIVALGVSIVANFQETGVPVVHGIGAIMAFICGVIYLWGQVIFSFVVRPYLCSIYLTIARLLLITVTTAALLLYMISQYADPFVIRFENGSMPTKEPKDDGIVRLEPSSPYYKNHIVTTVAEWVLGICLYVFVLTFAAELRRAYIHAPKLLSKKKYFGENKIHPVKNEAGGPLSE